MSQNKDFTRPPSILIEWKAKLSIIELAFNNTKNVKKLCEENPDLNKYDWNNNVCYGTKKHIDAIKQHGITKYHRKTFGICNNYS